MSGVMTENEIGTMVVETAIEIHRELGPGLFESVYEAILADDNYLSVSAPLREKISAP